MDRFHSKRCPSGVYRKLLFLLNTRAGPSLIILDVLSENIGNLIRKPNSSSQIVNAINRTISVEGVICLSVNVGGRVEPMQLIIAEGL